MLMLMLVFRSSLKERVHELLEQCDVRAYTEMPESIGAGQTGPAPGVSFYPGANNVIMVAVDEPHAERVADAVRAWCDDVTRLPNGRKPSIAIFSWPCRQVF